MPLVLGRAVRRSPSRYAPGRAPLLEPPHRLFLPGAETGGWEDRGFDRCLRASRSGQFGEEHSSGYVAIAGPWA